MTYDPSRHHRRSIRLPGYDYTRAGAYFITIVTHDRACLFGDVVDGDMRLNESGEIAHAEWRRTAAIRPRVVVDAFVVMPNHLHGIVILTDDGGRRGTLQRAPTQCAPATERFGQPTPGSIPTIVRLFKSATTKRINDMRGTPGLPVWQRNYYEHIIRDDESLRRIRQYIRDNPVHWAFDRDNPAAAAPEPERAWRS